VNGIIVNQRRLTSVSVDFCIPSSTSSRCNSRSLLVFAVQHSKPTCCLAHTEVSAYTSTQDSGSVSNRHHAGSTQSSSSSSNRAEQQLLQQRVHF
jgi:hypothetical protein